MDHFILIDKYFIEIIKSMSIKNLISDSKKNWFTLVEVLIGIVIVWLLVGIIFGIYVSTLRLSLKIENEKNLNNELLFFTQTIQNLVDNNDIDLSRYVWWDGIIKSNTLLGSQEDWYTDKLYLTSWSGQQLSIYKNGNCWSKEWCWVEMEKKDGTIARLTDPHKVQIENLMFKIIPYKFAQVEDIHQRWFWVLGSMSTIWYSTWKYERNIQQDIQLFYNIRKYK